MPPLELEKFHLLNRFMEDRWEREFAEIRSLLENLENEEQREALVARADAASDEELFEILAPLNDPLIQQNLQDVRDIVAARRRMIARTYGECTDCGTAIDYERLLAYPTAKRCIDCQRAHEQKKTAPAAGR